MGGESHATLDKMQIVDMWVSVSWTSIESDNITYHMAMRINDMLLVLDCSSSFLTESDKVVLCTS